MTTFTVEITLAFGADLAAAPSTWSFSTDITSYAMVREVGVHITGRGRADRQSVPQPSTMTVLLDNADGRFSRLNPLGAYYGQLSNNTPIRVRVNYGSGLVTRFTGFVSEWPVRWTHGQKHYWVPVRAEDVLRRLSQGHLPARSPLARFFTSSTYSPEIAAYWSCEDGASAAVAAEIRGGAPLTPVGPVTFGNTSDVPHGSSAAVGLASARLICTSIGRSDSFTGAGPAGIRFNAKCQAASVRLATIGLSNGITLYVVSGTSTTLLVRADSGATVHSVTVNTADGGWHSFALGLEMFSGNLVAQLDIDDAAPASGSLSTSVMGFATSLVFNQLASADMLELMHVAVTDDDRGALVHSRLTGDVGEIASPRWSELCDVAQVANDYLGQEESEELPNYPMGPDHAGDLISALTECADATEGVMYAARDGTLFLQTTFERENLDVTLALDYNAGHLVAPFEPVDDDALTRNDVTVSMFDGSLAQVVVDTGPKGTDAVGRYDESLPRNVETADDARHHAGWRTNLGTVDEYRYPSVNLNMARSQLSSLLDDIAAVEVGSRVTIDNLPANMPPDLVDGIVEGILSERITKFEWNMELNLSPYRPYRVFELAETSADQSEWIGRLAEDQAAAIRVAIDDNDTSILIDPNAFRWTAVADDFDPDPTVRFGGETATISAISATAATFVAAGTAASAHSADVTPGLPAGATTGDLLLIFAAIRTTSGGVNTPSGYRRLPIFHEADNCQVFGKVHSGSESAPTVSFTNGGVGNDTQAQMAAFRNTPITLTDLADVVLRSDTQLNASAQNIAVPHLPVTPYAGQVVLAFAAKQDDWTSVTSPTGFTEIGEPVSTVGSDQGITWGYRIDTTPALVSVNASFVVTGGTSAVSRSAIASIAAGYQTMTVSARSVNGVVKSHAVGTLITVENPGVLGL